MTEAAPKKRVRNRPRKEAPKTGINAKKMLPPEYEAEFVALCKEGYHLKTLSKRYHVHARIITRWMGERGLACGISPSGLKRPETDCEVRIRALWPENKTRAELAAEIGKSETWIYRTALKLELPWRAIDWPNGGAPWTEAEDAKVKAHWAKGALARNIAAVLPGRSPKAIVARAHALGLQGRAMAKRKGRVLPELLAPKIKECLEKHGASPLWRLRDYTNAPNPKVLRLALRQLLRAGEVQAEAHGVYGLVR